MRWFWIDKFVEFESGRHAVAVKNVSLAEEHLHDHFPGAPVMPNSLIVEGLAQTGGILVGEHYNFQQRVVLAKVSKVTFHLPALPGDTLTYRIDVLDINPNGAIVEGTSRINGELQAEAEIVFAHLDERIGGTALFEPQFMKNWLHNLRLFEVGRTADGQPLTLPPGLGEPAPR